MLLVSRVAINLHYTTATADAHKRDVSKKRCGKNKNNGLDSLAHNVQPYTQHIKCYSDVHLWVQSVPIRDRLYLTPCCWQHWCARENISNAIWLSSRGRCLGHQPTVGGRWLVYVSRRWARNNWRGIQFKPPPDHGGCNGDVKNLLAGCDVNFPTFELYMMGRELYDRRNKICLMYTAYFPADNVLFSVCSHYTQFDYGNNCG